MRRVGARCAQLDLVVRSVPHGVGPDDIADALGIPVAVALPHSRRLATGSDEGRLPSTRDGYGRACARALDVVLPGRR